MEIYSYLHNILSLLFWYAPNAVLLSFIDLYIVLSIYTLFIDFIYKNSIVHIQTNATFYICLYMVFPNGFLDAFQDAFPKEFPKRLPEKASRKASTAAR